MTSPYFAGTFLTAIMLPTACPFAHLPLPFSADRTTLGHRHRKSPFWNERGDTRNRSILYPPLPLVVNDKQRIDFGIRIKMKREISYFGLFCFFSHFCSAFLQSERNREIALPLRYRAQCFPTHLGTGKVPPSLPFANETRVGAAEDEVERERRAIYHTPRREGGKGGVAANASFASH